jgi:phage terminase small subunit
MPVLKNAKHEAVAQAFVADPERIGWRAYSGVYRKSSQHAAETSFSDLLKKPEFKARVDELLAAAADDSVMTAREVLQEYTKLARANTGQYFNPDNTFVGIGNLTGDQKCAIAGLEIEPTVIKIGRGKKAKLQLVNKVKFKLHDKRAALHDLARHHKLFGGEIDVGDIVVEIRKFANDSRGRASKAKTTKRAA